MIFYFSRTGNTQAVVEHIAERLGCESIEIETRDAYHQDYDTLVDLVRQQASDGYLPPLAQQIDLSGYDSGHPYTIIRPGWFDMSQPNQLQLVALQGDHRQSGTPKDGVIARRQLAQVLVASLLLPQAVKKTFELVAEVGPAATSLAPILDALEADNDGALDGALDKANMDLSPEPPRVVYDIDAFRATRSPSA